MKQILCFLLLASCGRIPKHIEIEHKALQEQISRIEPLLEWRCGLPTEPHRTDCSGDAVSMAGRWFLDTKDVSRLPFILASFGIDNRPYRNSEHPMYEGNSFSRDALMGILEVTVASGDFSALDKLEDYLSRTGRLCTGDDRCDLTPSMKLLMREVRGYNPTIGERLQDEATIQAEALAAPASYRMYLVLRKLRLKLETKNVTAGYQAALDVVLRRYPSGIFQRILASKYRQSEVELKSAADALVVCMQQWENAGDDWIGNAIDRECAAHSQGHELVGMAKWILEKR